MTSLRSDKIVGVRERRCIERECAGGGDIRIRFDPVGTHLPDGSVASFVCPQVHKMSPETGNIEQPREFIKINRNPPPRCPTNSPLLTVQHRTQTNRLGRTQPPSRTPTQPTTQKQSGPGFPRISKTYARTHPSSSPPPNIETIFISIGGLPRRHNSRQR
jgi:hypothetical protein